MTQQSQALVYVMCMPLYYQEYKFSLKTSPYYASGAESDSTVCKVLRNQNAHPEAGLGIRS